MSRITVSLKERSYPVFISENMVSNFPASFRELFSRRKCVLVTNSTIAKLYSKVIAAWQQELDFTLYVMPDGEKHKTVKTWNEVIDSFIDHHLDRRDYVIALGGGVVGDVAGFAAAAYMRGIDYVQVPTTLLAMVDSSVGGKTAVDHPRGKNLIGAFHQPRGVWADLSFLKSLPRREFVGGCAELFKYGFIGGEQMFTFVKQNSRKLIDADPEVLMDGVYKSVETKAKIVGEDEKESGKRALLNFGHTFAHALEQFYGFEGLIHGEALIWGMVCACEMGSRNLTMMSSDKTDYRKLLCELPVPRLPYEPDAHLLYKTMFTDKKASGGKLHFILPSVPGKAVVVKDVSEKMVMDTLESVLIKKSSAFLSHR